jgi:hypothetical protein
LPDLDEYSPPPGTGALNTNLSSENSTLTQFSKLLAAGDGTVVTGGSNAVYIGSDPAGSDSTGAPSAGGGSGTTESRPGTGDANGGEGGATGGGSSGGGTSEGGGSGGGSDNQGGIRGDRVFSGAVSGTRHEDLDEHGSLTESEQRNISIGVSATGELMSIYIPGFIFYPDVNASFSSTGDSEQFAGSVGVGNVSTAYTIIATLRSMEYGESSATATVDLRLNSSGGSLITQGAGVHTLNVSWSSSSMTYSSNTHYEMEFMPAPGTPNEWYFTPECDYDLSGTLH